MLNKIKSLKDNQGFMKYFSNTSWLFAEKILRTFVGLFIGIWFARYLGPEQFGLYSYILSFVGLFSAIANLGLDAIVVRELVKNFNEKNKIIGTAFTLKIIGSLLLLMVLIIVVQFTNNDDHTNMLIFIVAGASFFSSFNVIDFYFQSKVLSRYVVYSNVISLSISSIIKIILIINSASLTTFIWVIVFDSFVLVLGYLYFYYHKNLSVRDWNFNLNFAKTLLKDSWPLILSSMVVSMYIKIDQVMLKSLMDSSAVGQYAAAVRLSEAWYFVPVILANSLFPAIINAKKNSDTLYKDRMQTLYSLLVWLAILVAIPMTFLSDWIINFLFGNAYNEAGSVLMLHIWTGIFVCLSVASGKWYINENLMKHALYRNIWGVIINICLNLLLVPYYGIQGAAIATFVSFTFSGYIFDSLSEKTRPAFYQKTSAFLYLFKYKKLRGMFK